MPEGGKAISGGSRAMENSASWEKIHTVTEMDGHPLRGMADYKGEPHLYDAGFDVEMDQYSGFYWLEKVTPRPFRAVP